MQNTTPTFARFARFAFAVANHVDDEDKGVTEMMPPPAASGRSSRPRAVKRSACCVRVSKRRQEQ